MTQFILNSGFESLDGPNDFSNWTETVGGYVTDETSTVHSGSHSVKLPNATPTSYIYQDISPPHTGQYKLKLYARSVVGFGTLRVSIALDMPWPFSTIMLEQTYFAVTDTEWTEIVVYFEVLPGYVATNAVRLDLQPEASSVYVDDVTIEDVDLETADQFANGDFEEWRLNTGTPSNWAVQSDDIAYITKDTSIKRDGAASMRVNGDGDPQPIQTFVIAPNTTVDFGIWYRGDGVSTSGWVEYYVVDCDTADDAYDGVYVTGDTWSKLSGQFTVGSAGGVGSFWIYAPNAGEYNWYDDAYVLERVELLDNPGFEDRTGDDWTDWTDISCSAETSIVHGGSTSVNMSSANAWIQNQPSQNMEPGLYQLSVWVYQTGGAKLRLRADESFEYYSSYRIFQENDIEVTPSTWTKVTRYFDTLAIGGTSHHWVLVSFQHESSTGTSLYIDDASLTRVEPWTADTLHNGGFEVWRSENNYPAMWVVSDPTVSLVTKDATTKLLGSYSLRVESAGGLFPDVGNIIGIPSGPMTFRVALRGDGTTGTYVYAQAYGDLWYDPDYMSVEHTSTDWTYYTYSVDVPDDPQSVIEIYFSLGGSVDGYGWVDGVELLLGPMISEAGNIGSGLAWGNPPRIAADPAFVGVSMITPITVSLEDAFTGLTVSEIVTTTVSLEEEII